MKVSGRSCGNRCFRGSGQGVVHGRQNPGEQGRLDGYDLNDTIFTISNSSNHF